jgi:signal peptidase II
MTRQAKIFVVLILVVTTVGCDRVTKRLATVHLAGASDRSFLADTIRFEYAENRGGMLSIGSDWRPAARNAVFIVATGIILITMLIIGVKYHPSDWRIAAMSLAFAGGASNLLDRVIRGSVVDFLNVGVGNIRTGVFNVADVAIFAGIFMFLISRDSPARARK